MASSPWTVSSVCCFDAQEALANIKCQIRLLLVLTAQKASGNLGVFVVLSALNPLCSLAPPSPPVFGVRLVSSGMFANSGSNSRHTLTQPQRVYTHYTVPAISKVCTEYSQGPGTSPQHAAAESRCGASQSHLKAGKVTFWLPKCCG